MQEHTAQLRQKIRDNVPTVGSWITTADPSVAEIMAAAGFEWLTVDMEHSALTLREVKDFVRVIGCSGVVPLVRVGVNDANLIKRVMDTGAGGVIVPMVNTKEQAEQAVKAVKYPPLGVRGVGLSRAQGYGFSFPSYRSWVNEHSIVIVQIEHIEAARNIEAILSVEGVDAFIVGPFDLSGSVGCPGEFDHPQVKDALERVLSVARRLNVPAGFHVIPPDPAALQAKLEEGYRFLAFSLDTLFLGTACREALEAVRRQEG